MGSRSDIYKDDEVPNQTVPRKLDGDVKFRIIHSQKAPKGVCQFKVLLEIKGIGPKEGRLGVDLVMVLDVSGSMRGERMAKMKLAMRFLLQKLGDTDRVSVVVFNRKATRLCPLRNITGETRKEIEKQVDNLTARSSTNTEAALEMALQILKQRNHVNMRHAAIMLMSDGVEDEGSHAGQVRGLSSVPVYTFSYGSDCNHEVLSEIAKKSNGGMFAAVPYLDNLNVAFSTALAGILSFAIKDLTLAIKPLHGSQLNEVYAGTYLHTKNIRAGDPVTISFGTLYDREIRRVLVVLTLPKVERELDVEIFNINYRVDGKNTPIKVTRTDMSTKEENEELLVEERRIRTVRKMTEAKKLADGKELVPARKKLTDAKKNLSEVDAILTAQLDQLFLYMASKETYTKHGSAFALALEASHKAQRATTVPTTDVFQADMFKTPLMDLLIEQARLFDQDPKKYQVPTEEEDKKIIALVH